MIATGFPPFAAPTARLKGEAPVAQGSQRGC
jgi:hypothetical protein